MSKNYIIEHTDNGYIKIMLKNKPGVNYFSDNDTFLEVLDEWHVTMSYRKGGWLKADIWKGEWRGRVQIYMYDLALACYLGMVHADTLVDDLKKYYAWKESQGPTIDQRAPELTIDHLDNNTSNNVAENIVLMTLLANDQKRSFPAGFVGPYTLTMAYVDGECRVQLALEVTAIDELQRILGYKVPRVPGAVMSTLRFICPDENCLVACLKYLYDSEFRWCNPGESARAYKRLHKGISHLAADVERSIEAQRALARMDRSQFQTFTAGEKSYHALSI